ncbi:WD40 repeat domain-containing protein [Pontiellaceae bacterium B12227]|nr:WD40 repeat domain-containing protein [Pontiellaceae bacterium B12227]
MKKSLLLALAGLTAFVAQAAVPCSVFDADFEGSVATDATAGSLTVSNLNAGTVTGTWSLGADGGSVANYAAVITNATSDANALMLATGAYDATATFSEIAVLEGTTVSLDAYLRNKAGNAPENSIIGLDSSGRGVFEVILSGDDVSTNQGYRAVGYRDASDTVHYLGTNLLQVQQYNEYNPSKNGTLLLTLGAASMDIEWNGTALTNGIAFKDGAAANLAEIHFAGDGSKAWEGMVYDDIVVQTPWVGTWYRHEAPSPVWMVAPREDDGVYLGCQDQHIYSLDENGSTEWAFDSKGHPSVIISAEFNGASAGTEVLVASHDRDGMLYLLSEAGGVLGSYSNGSPFVSADVLTTTNGETRICAASYDNQIHFFDNSLNLLQTRAFSTDDRWPQAVKAGDVTGDGQDDFVALHIDRHLQVYSADGALLASTRVDGTWQKGDLFLVDIDGDTTKEILVVSGSGGKETRALEYSGGSLSALWTNSKLLTSSGMTLIDDFLPAAGLDVLCFNPDINGNTMSVLGLGSGGLTERVKRDSEFRMPLCVALGEDSTMLYAGSVGTRESAYYSIPTTVFESENHPLLPEVDTSTTILANLATAVWDRSQEVPATPEPYVVFIRANAKPQYRDLMQEHADIAAAFMLLAPHVKVIMEFPVNTVDEGQMSNAELVELTTWLETDGIPFTFDISSGCSPRLTTNEIEWVLNTASNMCFGFSTSENSALDHPAGIWQTQFSPFVLATAELCREYGKMLIIQENGLGWKSYMQVDQVINQWLAPELKRTIIPIVRSNKNGAYVDYLSLLGLETAGLTEGWGVSTQDWMWFHQGKHLIPGMLPPELLTRNNMMVAAMGGRYFHFESGVDAFNQMEKITSSKPWGLKAEGVFFEYLRKGVFQGYSSSNLQNLSTHAVGVETNDNFSATGPGVLGQQAALEHLPEGNIYNHLAGVPYNKVQNFKTPFGLVPVVPYPVPDHGDTNRYELIRTDGEVYLGADLVYNDPAELTNTFSAAAQQQPFRTGDAFISAFPHEGGYLLYLVGTDYFEIDDGPVAVEINPSLGLRYAWDFVTGETVAISNNQIATDIQGGVVRVLNVHAADVNDTYYMDWLAEHELSGFDAWESADLEPDGLNNWTEYALGGNPDLNDAEKVLPMFGENMGGGSASYVYRRRNDYQARGLVYTVEATTNLISNLWNSNGVVGAGFGAIDAEMDSVTNRVSTEELPEQFIRLRVE